MRTLEQFKQLAAGVTRGYTSNQLTEIARLCFRGQESGKPVPVWHAAAIVGGHLDRCQCVPCCKAREKKR